MKHVIVAGIIGLRDCTRAARRPLCVTFFSVVLVAELAFNAAPHYAQSVDGIARSDVAFAKPAGHEVYRQYGATLVAWGFQPFRLTGDDIRSEWKRSGDRAHSVGVRYQARVEIDAGWRGMIDFDPICRESACINLAGQPILYGFWSGRYKGHPPCYFCSNAPRFRKYLIHQASEALAGHPDMLMIDGIHPLRQRRGTVGVFARNSVVRCG